MEIDVATNLINTVGFPIFCVVALGLFIYKSYTRITEANQKREEKLYQIIADNHTEMERLEETNAQFAECISAFKADIEIIKDKVTKSERTLAKSNKEVK